MTLFFWSEKYGTAGAAVTGTTTSDADGGKPPNTVTLGTGGAITYDGSFSLGHGYPNSVKIDVNGTAGSNYMQWTTNLTYGTPFIASACFYLTAYPLSGRLIQILTSGGTTKCGLNVNASGVISIFDSASAGQGNMSTTIPLNQWIRLDLKVIANSTTVGQMEAKLYLDPFSATVTETLTTTANKNTNATAAGQIRIGYVTSQAQTSDIWVAYPQFSNTTTYPGAVPDISQTYNRTASDSIGVGSSNNLQPYGSFESGTPTPTDLVTTTVATDTTQHWTGSQSLKFTPSATTWAFDFDNPTTLQAAVSPSTQYTISCYIYTTLSGQTVTPGGDWFQSDGTSYITSDGGSAQALTPNTWTRVSYTTTSPSGAGKFALGMSNTSTWSAGTPFWLDGVQVELGATATTWGPGPNDPSVGAADVATGTVLHVKTGTGSDTVSGSDSLSRVQVLARSAAESLSVSDSLASAKGNNTWRNTAEGGTSGTTVTASDTYSDNSLPWDTVNQGFNATMQYDNTHVLLGTTAYKVASAGTAASAYLRWLSPGSFPDRLGPAYLSACFYLTANPSTTGISLGIRSSTDSAQCAVQFDSSGVFNLIVGSGTLYASSTTPIPLNQWFRVELGLLASSTTVGQAEMRIFTNPFSSTPTETITTPATQNTGGGNPGRTAVGFYNQWANQGPMWIDQIQFSTSGYPSAPAGTTYNRTASESLTVSDSNVNAILRVRSVSESLTTSDSPARSSLRSRSTSETLSNSDLASRAIVVLRSATDTTSLADLASRLAQIPRSATESVGLTDSLARKVVFARSPAETLTVTESAVGNKGRSSNPGESLTTSDSLVRSQVLSRAVSDTSSTSDSLGSGSGFVKTASDILTTSDSLTRTIALARAGSESLSISDSADSTQGRIATASDTLSTSDTLGRSQVLSRAVSDTQATSDLLTSGSVYFKPVSESLTTSDSVLRAAPKGRTSGETVSGSDSVDRATSRPRAATDSVSGTDSVARSLTYGRNPTDSNLTTESLTRALRRVRVPTETLSLSESLGFTKSTSTYFNTGEGGSNGATVALTDTYTDGSLPWTKVNIGFNATNQYTTSRFFLGATSYKFASSAGTAASAYLEWDETAVTFQVPFYVSVCCYFTAFPANPTVVVSIRTANGATGQATIEVASNGKLNLKAGGGTIATSTSVIPLNQWIRLEAAVLISDATNGKCELRLFNNAASTTPTETVTGTNVNTVGGLPDTVRFGLQNQWTSQGPVWMDQMQASIAGYPSAPVGGNQQIGVVVADFLTTTDTVGRSAQNFRASVSEPIPTADAATRSAATHTAVTDSIAGLIDVAAPQIFAGRQGTEFLIISDAANIIGASGLRSLIDSIPTSEILTRGVTNSRSVSDASSFSDTATSTKAPGRRATDTLSASDTATAHFTRSTKNNTENIPTSDVATRQGVFYRQVDAGQSVTVLDGNGSTPLDSNDDGVLDGGGFNTDPVFDGNGDVSALYDGNDTTYGTTTIYDGGSSSDIFTTDSAVGVRGKPRTASEALTLSEVVSTGIVNKARFTIETIGTFETTSRLARLTRALGEAVTGTDSVVRSQTVVRSSSDTRLLTDTVTRTLKRFRDSAESTAVSDSAISGQVITGRSVSETTTISDSVSVQISPARSTTDSLSVSDQSARTVLAKRSPDETTSHGESVSRVITRVRAATDSISATDSAHPNITTIASASETLTTFDVVARKKFAFRDAQDSLPSSFFNGLVDFLAYSRSLKRSFTEDLSTSDEAFRNSALSASPHDSVSGSDSVVAKGFRFRPAVEDVSGSFDAAYRISVLTRANSESLSFSENLVRYRTLVSQLVTFLPLTDVATRTVSLGNRIYGPPVPEITSVSTRKVSLVESFDQVTIDFTFDRPVDRWVVRIGSTDAFSGNAADSYSGDPVTSGSAVISADLLRVGDNEVQVYGRSATSGEWTRRREGDPAV